MEDGISDSERIRTTLRVLLNNISLTGKDGPMDWRARAHTHIHSPNIASLHTGSLTRAEA